MSLTFCEFPVNSKGLIYSLIYRYIEFISYPPSFSLFHESLSSLFQKRYSILLSRLIFHFNFSKLLIPTILSDALDVKIPQELFAEDRPSLEILVQWVSQNVSLEFNLSLRKLLSSLRSRSRLNTRTHISKVLQFLNDHPQPFHFWNFFSYFYECLSLSYPSYERIALGKFFFLRYLCPLIRLIGENQHHYATIADGLATLVLSLHAPSTMLPQNSDRDLMIKFLSKLKNSPPFAARVPDVHQSIDFAAITPSEYIEFFELVPKLTSGFHAKLREGKFHDLESKWIFLMLEWSSQLDALSDVSSIKKHALLFPVVEREMDVFQSTSTQLNSPTSDPIKLVKKKKKMKKPDPISPSSSNSSCITENSYAEDLMVPDDFDELSLSSDDSERTGLFDLF